MRVSVSDLGAEADGPSYAPSISADGRFVAFHGSATNIVIGFSFPGQGGLSDIDVFVHDRDTDEDEIFDEAGSISTVLISHTLGLEANGNSYFASMSANGRFVTFQSEATFLVPGDGNGTTDVFVRNLVTDEMIRASVDSLGVEGNGPSTAGAISDDGRFIAIASDATNLIGTDTGGYTDIFFRDRGVNCPADLNGDHVVDTIDLDILNQNWGSCVCCAADLDGDGSVDTTDLLILLASMGSCP